jgi:diguanylate cyclase (GGDEF)-like protein
MSFRLLPENSNKLRLVVILTGFVLTGLIGFVDFLTGYEFAFSVFYAIPVAIVTWYISLPLGLLTSLLSAMVWLGADFSSSHPYSHQLIPLWNAFIRLTFFVIITVLLAKLKNTLDREKEYASIDNLTGAFNPRFFHQLVQMEINRFKRFKEPFSFAYIDLDNFKTVNDQFGHSTGDQVLRSVVSCIKKYLRKTDVIARLGGDEFALLLPDTDEGSNQVVLCKIQSELLHEMEQCNWPITFSIGSLTCIAVPDSAEELVKMADELMYTVKHSNKNAIKYFTYSGIHQDPNNLSRHLNIKS